MKISINSGIPSGPMGVLMSWMGGRTRGPQTVTTRIHKLYEQALAEKDYPTQALLQWFITEQVEEEKNASDIIEQLKLIDARGTAVLMLDHRLGKSPA